MKGFGRLCTEANNEALRGWFTELLIQMDLAEPRRNPQRQLPKSRTNANDIPYVYEFPLVNPETPIVPLRPQDFIIFAHVLQPHPAAFVSANEFERFKERIKTELAAQSAKIYKKLSHFRLVRELGGERRNFNRGEGRGDVFIINVFGSQGEGMNFNIILLFYP